MSNRLYNIAMRVRDMRANSGLRPIHASEKAVLKELANDARDAKGDRSHMGAAEVARRCDISVPTVRRAYAALQASGHITREAGALGEVSATIVHPQIGDLAAARSESPRYAPHVTMIGGAYHGDTGPSKKEDYKPITHAPQARAQADFQVSGEEQKEAAGMAQPVATVPDHITAVFDAWDEMHERAGLPGPITRDAVRRVAIAKIINRLGLGEVLALIGHVEKTVRAGGMRRKGQTDCFATFDVIFEIGHAAGLRVLTRLCDSEWGKISAPKPKEPAMNFPLSAVTPHEPPDIAKLRELLRAKLGMRMASTWIDPLHFEHALGELRITARSAFVADSVRTDFNAAIVAAAAETWPNEPGLSVRVMVAPRDLVAA